jgi:hypothetical protein
VDARTGRFDQLLHGWLPNAAGLNASQALALVATSRFPCGRQVVTFSCRHLQISNRYASTVAKEGASMAVRKRRYTAEQDELYSEVVNDPGNQSNADSEAAASDISSVLERATAFTLEEIDHLIIDLASSRDALNSEAARVQREVVQYSTLSQAALQSTKIISESLMQFRKPVEARGLD